VVVRDVGLRRPTLDDVFLTLTGRSAEAAADTAAAQDAAATERSPRQQTPEARS
jgi:ABC-2 type transport system ATP-binding protein